jgi:hypothetical protein
VNTEIKLLTGAASQRAPPRSHTSAAFSLALPKEKAWPKERLVVGERKITALRT